MAWSWGSPGVVTNPFFDASAPVSPGSGDDGGPNLGQRPGMRRCDPNSALIRGLFLFVLAVQLPLAASCFALDRVDDVAPGEIAGRAVRRDLDEAAPFARVSTLGAPLLRTTDNDGRFRFPSQPIGPVSLALVDDADGDGWPDRGGYVAAFIPRAPDGDAGFVILGDIDLEGTFGLRGSVFVDQPGGAVTANTLGYVARVYALRGICSTVDESRPAQLTGLSCDSAQDVATRLQIGSEAEAAADGAGAWQMTRLVAGAMDFAAVLYEVNGDGTLGAVVDVVGPVSFLGSAQDDNAPPSDLGPQLLFDGVPPPPVDVDLALLPGARAGAFAVFLSPGAEIPVCDAVDDTQQRPVEGDLARVTDVPAGSYDVLVCDGDRQGLATGQFALPSVDGTVGSPWPVRLLDFDPCVISGDRDCDADNRIGLPQRAGDNASLWGACALQCFPDGSPLGEGIGDRTCTVEEQTFDCDDDGDGQPDVTEPAACYGPGRGTDLDGDGLCSTTDPFPHCADNDAVLCVAGQEDVTPRVVSDAVRPGTDWTEGELREGPQLPEGVRLGTRGAALPWSQGGDGVLTDIVLVGLVDGDDGLLDLVLHVPLSSSGEASAPEPLGRFVDVGIPEGPRADFAVGIDAGAYFLIGGSNELDTPTLFASRYRLSSSQAISFEEALPLSAPRRRVAAVSSASGLLAVGGISEDGAFVDVIEPAGAEPMAPSGTLAIARAGAVGTSVFLDPEVYTVVIGGEGSEGALASVETFNAQTVAVASPEALPDLVHPRKGHTLTELPSGTLLVIGGEGDEASATTAEVYDPDGDAAWTEIQLAAAHSYHSATLLPDHRVLIVGGYGAEGAPSPLVEIVDLVTRSTRVIGSLLSGRAGHQAVQVAPGQVILVGGVDAAGAVLGTTEIIDLRRKKQTIDVAGNPDDVGCVRSAISDDGSRVAMVCDQIPARAGTFLGAGEGHDIIVVDVLTGAAACVSCGYDGSAYVAGHVDPTQPVHMSADGRRIAFVTSAPFSVFDVNGGPDAYLADVPARIDPFSTSLRAITEEFDAMSQGTTFFGVAAGTDIALSADGSAVAVIAIRPSISEDPQLYIGVVPPFGSVALSGASSINDGLAPPGTVWGRPSIETVHNAAFGLPAAFLRLAIRTDIRTGASGELDASFADFAPGSTPSALSFLPAEVAAGDVVLSKDGTHVAWWTAVDDRLGGDLDGQNDLYVGALGNGTLSNVVRITESAPDHCPDATAASCAPPSLTGPGRVLYESSQGGTAHVRLFEVDTTQVISATTAGETAAAAAPSLSAAGTFASFTSAVVDLVEPALSPSAPRVFRIDLNALLGGSVAEGEGEGEGIGEVEPDPPCAEAVVAPGPSGVDVGADGPDVIIGQESSGASTFAIAGLAARSEPLRILGTDASLALTRGFAKNGDLAGVFGFGSSSGLRYQAASGGQATTLDLAPMLRQFGFAAAPSIVHGAFDVLEPVFYVVDAGNQAVGIVDTQSVVWTLRNAIGVAAVGFANPRAITAGSSRAYVGASDQVLTVDPNEGILGNLQMPGTVVDLFFDPATALLYASVDAAVAQVVVIDMTFTPGTILNQGPVRLGGPPGVQPGGLHVVDGLVFVGSTIVAEGVARIGILQAGDLTHVSSVAVPVDNSSLTSLVYDSSNQTVVAGTGVSGVATWVAQVGACLPVPQ